LGALSHFALEPVIPAREKKLQCTSIQRSPAFPTGANRIDMWLSILEKDGFI